MGARDEYYENYPKSKPGYFWGDHYDSQLEGQTAYFFCLIGARYRRCTRDSGDYFELNDGLSYRPDFYLYDVHFTDCKQIGAYVEVKPKEPDALSLKKMTELCRLQEKNMILVIGQPIKTQINSIGDNCAKSAWIIYSDGTVRKNCSFFRINDLSSDHSLYISDMLFIDRHAIKRFVEEAEKAGTLKFDEDGLANFMGTTTFEELPW